MFAQYTYFVTSQSKYTDHVHDMLLYTQYFNVQRFPLLIYPFMKYQLRLYQNMYVKILCLHTNYCHPWTLYSWNLNVLKTVLDILFENEHTCLQEHLDNLEKERQHPFLLIQSPNTSDTATPSINDYIIKLLNLMITLHIPCRQVDKV